MKQFCILLVNQEILISFQIKKEYFMQFYKSFFPNETILHIACESKNIDLVKYLISLKKIDVKSKTVFFMFIFKCNFK